jgi:hypothetical protein
MGYNTVAVLYNDHADIIAKSGPVGERIAESMRRYHETGRYPLSRVFGVGVIISQDHADAEQVVIISRNFGWRADEATNLGWQALHDMAECLQRHGYTVKEPPKK